MKKICILIEALIMIISLCSCTTTKAPSEEQVKAICELSVMECYYNNVAKSTKEKGSGITHIFEKTREFWIQYEGVAEIGIDMNKVSMKMKGKDIFIKMPKAELLEMSILKETFNEDSYVITSDSFWNKNKITVEEQQEAINNAQQQMRETILGNKIVFERAESEAKNLIANYINKLGEASGIQYNIVWE